MPECRIALRNGEEAIVDEEDFAECSKYKWGMGSGYVVATVRQMQGGVKGQRVYMHRLIRPEGRTTHLDGNRLNNTRANLVPVAGGKTMQLGANPDARYKGVHQSGKRWRAIVMHKGQRHCVGTFDDPIDAARAYDVAARQIIGEAAYQNGV